MHSVDDQPAHWRIGNVSEYYPKEAVAGAY